MEQRSILVVEDDHIFSIQLEMMLETIFSNSLEVTRCASSDEAAKILTKKKFDALLIDVALESEKSGIHLAESVNPLESTVIFMTAFKREDLFQLALKTNPTHFLHKPFSADQIRIAIEVAFARQKLLRERGVGLASKSILLKGRNGQTERVYKNSLIGIEAFGNYCRFYLTNGSCFTKRMKLKEYNEILPDSNFLQIHRSWVVNLELLEKINTQAQEVTIAGKTFPVGLKYKAKLFSSLQD